jgi:hypothetical protein
LPPARLILALLIAGVAMPAEAQLFGRRAPSGPPVAPPPDNLPAYEAEIWPFPPPDPKSWWEDKWPKADEAADPLGGRRIYRGERLTAIDNGIDASTYRLWGLMPLQWQVVRGDEMILELWVRPARSVRQTVVRVTVRRDGDAFVNARAGLACCEAGIGRRIGFDRKLPAGSAARFQALKDHPMWSAPREVRVDEGGGTSEAVCVDGTSYDLTLVVPGRSRSLRRACDLAEIGQAADVLEPVLQAAMGVDPRFDVIFPGGVSYASARGAYEDLIASGGRLKAAPTPRGQPRGLETAPPEEEVTPPPGEAPP